MRIESQVLSEIEIDRFNVIVKGLLLRYTAITLSEPSVLVDNSIHIDVSEEVGLQPALYKVNVLSIPMAEYHCVLCVLVNEEHLKF